MAINTRRRFLKNAVAAFTLPIINPLGLYVVSSKQEVKTSIWLALVEYARWCPTVHNLQPHKVKIISETEAELYYDPARLLPIGDPGARFVTVAMGIFKEHLSIAASLYHKKVVLTEIVAPIKITGTDVTLFARLKLVPFTQPEELDPGLFLKRRTSRLKYDHSPIQEEIIARIKKEAETFKHELFSSSDSELVGHIIDLNQETLFEDLHSKANCNELHQLFRYTEADANWSKDGLWAKCMGFPGPLMEAVFTNPQKWLTGLRKVFLAKKYKASFKGTTTLCWISGEFSTSSDWFEAGRLLARNWLLLTRYQVYIQPFGSLITNAHAYEKIIRKLPPATQKNKIWMVFRVGYSQEPARSFRLSTAEIIIS